MSKSLEECVEAAKLMIEEQGEDLKVDEYIDYLSELTEHLSILHDAARHTKRTSRGGNDG